MSSARLSVWTAKVQAATFAVKVHTGTDVTSRKLEHEEDEFSCLFAQSLVVWTEFWAKDQSLWSESAEMQNWTVEIKSSKTLKADKSIKALNSTESNDDEEIWNLSFWFGIYLWCSELQMGRSESQAP